MEYQRNDKDCLICCLSNLLKIPYEKIPKFYLYYNNKNWKDMYDQFLKENGYYRIEFNPNYNKEKNTMEFYSSSNIKCIAILSKNGKDHAVLININSKRVWIVNDPAGKDSVYKITDIKEIQLIFKLKKRRRKYELRDLEGD